MKWFILVLCMLLLVGCENAGLSIAPPTSDFSVSRTIEGNTVTLEINEGTLASDEVVVIAEVSEGMVVGSASVEPYAEDNEVMVWLFANNPPQTIKNTEITESIPSTITYETTASVRGKWGLYVANSEGMIGASNGEQNNDAEDEASEDGDQISISEVLSLIDQLVAGEAEIGEVLAAIDAYVRWVNS